MTEKLPLHIEMCMSLIVDKAWYCSVWQTLSHPCDTLSTCADSGLLNSMSLKLEMSYSRSSEMLPLITTDMTSYQWSQPDMV